MVGVQETSKDESAVKENTPGYFFITMVICVVCLSEYFRCDLLWTWQDRIYAFDSVVSYLVYRYYRKKLAKAGA